MRIGSPGDDRPEGGCALLYQGGYSMRFCPTTAVPLVLPTAQPVAPRNAGVTVRANLCYIR